MTTKELIAELRGHANRMTSAWPNATAAVRAAADMLEAQFVSAERDAEALRQLRAEISSLKFHEGNYAALRKIDTEEITQLRAALAAAKEALRTCIRSDDPDDIGWNYWFDHEEVASTLAKIEAISLSSKPENPC